MQIKQPSWIHSSSLKQHLRCITQMLRSRLDSDTRRQTATTPLYEERRTGNTSLDPLTKISPSFQLCAECLLPRCLAPPNTVWGQAPTIGRPGNTNWHDSSHFCRHGGHALLSLSCARCPEAEEALTESTTIAFLLQSNRAGHKLTCCCARSASFDLKGACHRKPRLRLEFSRSTVADEVYQCSNTTINIISTLFTH